MDLYIAIPRIAQVVDRQILKLDDVCNICCVDKNLEQKVKNLDIFVVPERKAANYTVSIMEVIERVLRENELKDLTISWIGEKNVLIEYLPVLKKKNKLLEYLTVAFVSSVIFFGSMTALMSFQVETDMTGLIEATLEILVGEEAVNARIISIPYALGITSGIILFFNHIGGKKITTDPTPIEIEMLNFDMGVALTANEQLELRKRQYNEKTKKVEEVKKTK